MVDGERGGTRMLPRASYLDANCQREEGTFSDNSIHARTRRSSPGNGNGSMASLAIRWHFAGQESASPARSLPRNLDFLATLVIAPIRSATFDRRHVGRDDSIDSPRFAARYLSAKDSRRKTLETASQDERRDARRSLTFESDPTALRTA